MEIPKARRDHTHKRRFCIEIPTVAGYWFYVQYHHARPQDHQAERRIRPAPDLSAMRVWAYPPMQSAHSCSVRRVGRAVGERGAPLAMLEVQRQEMHGVDDTDEDTARGSVMIRMCQRKVRHMNKSSPISVGRLTTSRMSPRVIGSRAQ